MIAGRIVDDRNYAGHSQSKRGDFVPESYHFFGFSAFGFGNGFFVYGCNLSYAEKEVDNHSVTTYEKFSGASMRPEPPKGPSGVAKELHYA